MPFKNIKLVPAEGTWVVRAGGAVIGESTRAMELTDGDGASEIYFPREDIGMAFLEISDHATETEGIGQARYYGIVTRSTTIQRAAWSYPEPKQDLARLAHLIAFDTDKVAVEQV
jgi:uncharacterized protein (DUF427 family)